MLVLFNVCMWEVNRTCQKTMSDREPYKVILGNEYEFTLEGKPLQYDKTLMPSELQRLLSMNIEDRDEQWPQAVKKIMWQLDVCDNCKDKYVEIFQGMGDVRAIMKSFGQAKINREARNLIVDGKRVFSLEEVTSFRAAVNEIMAPTLAASVLKNAEMIKGCQDMGFVVDVKQNISDYFAYNKCAMEGES